MGGGLMTDEDPTCSATGAPDVVASHRGGAKDDPKPASPVAGGRRVLLRRLVRVSLAVVGLLVVIAAGASIWAWAVSAGHIETAGDDDTTRAPVAIVLGAAVLQPPLREAAQLGIDDEPSAPPRDALSSPATAPAQQE